MLPISRENALQLMGKYNQDKQDIIHFLESEAIMRELAVRLGENVEYWGMLGLLHDIDWGITKHDSREHLTKAPEILKSAGFNDEFVQAVLSHGYGWDCAGLK
jgi:putative nucleotidyltransferase with HDIG domain